MRVFAEWSEFTIKRDTTVPTCRLYAQWLEVAVKTISPALGGWSVGSIRIG